MNRILRTAALIFLATTFAGHLQSVERDWTNKAGRTIKGTLISFDGEQASISVGGKVFEIASETLSRDDQSFLEAWSESHDERTTPSSSSGAALVFDFSDQELGVWPRSVDSELTEEDVIIVGQDPESKLFIYQTDHFEFHVPDQLATSVVRDFARTFESTFLLIEQAPLGLNPTPPTDTLFKAYLYKTEAEYYADGGLPGSGGMASWRRTAAGEMSSIIKIPMPNLGVKYTGRRYVVDLKADNETLVHELAHQIMLRWMPIQPVWMKEGFAEFFSSLKLSGGKIVISNPERQIREAVSFGRKDVPCTRLGPLMTATSQSWKRALANGNRFNYPSANLLLTYFAFMDGDGDGEHLVACLKTIAEGSQMGDAVSTHLLRGRSYAELEEDFAKQWNRNGLNIKWVGKP